MENKDIKNESNQDLSKESKTSNEIPKDFDFKKAYKDKLKEKDDQIDKLKMDVENWKNEYYKAYADMANLRKSMEKDQKDVYKYRIEGFVQNLLSVLDGFDMAFKNEPTSVELKNYLTGFQYVYKQLRQILSDEGIIEIDPKINEKFDVTDMHAIETVEDEGEENLVKQVSLKGYRLHDHLIRPAMVIVSKHSEKKNDANIKDDNVKKESK